MMNFRRWMSKLVRGMSSRLFGTNTTNSQQPAAQTSETASINGRATDTDRMQSAETTEAQAQENRYLRIQAVEDIDEAYRLCLEFLHAKPFALGPYASYVPYVEMLYQRVVGGEADGPRMLHMLGLIALSRSDAPTTRRFLERAVRADPRDAEIHNSLGFALCQERKFLAASLVLAKAVTLCPDLTAAQTNLNLARQGLGGGL